MLVFINGQQVDNPTENKEFLELIQMLPVPDALKQMFKKEEDLFDKKYEDFVKEEDLSPGFVSESLKEELIDVNSDVKKELVEEAPCTGNPETCERCGESLLVDFSDALDALKEGYTVTRKSWLEQGKTRFLYLVSPNVYPARTEVAQKVFGDEVPYSGYIALKTDAGYVTPYTPTTSDLLSEDWFVIQN